MRNVNVARWLRGFGALALGLALPWMGGCPGQPKVPATQAAATEEAPRAILRMTMARRQSSYARLELPVVATGMRIDVGAVEGNGEWEGGEVGMYRARLYRGAVTGPAVDQLMGTPRAGMDVGSYLVPMVSQKTESGREYLVTEAMPLWVEVRVGAAQEPGVYEVPVRVTRAGVVERYVVEVVVADLALPTEPRVMGAVTTTGEELAGVFADTFGQVVVGNMERGNADFAGAVEQLDALVRAAHAQGMGFFVEDFGPKVKVDEVGKVALEWDAYDSVMQPYMDGTAFGDRVPMQVWLAPVPPRRVRDEAAQLRQYVSGCMEHFVSKGWVGVPAFMHPALIAPPRSSANSEDDRAAREEAALRGEISRTLTLHMSRDMLAVVTPEVEVPHPKMWVVEDGDARLPPAGALASEQSVRVWPWVCGARGVRGFVWRGGIARGEDLKNENEVRRPLFVVEGGKGGTSLVVLPSLRMAWLNAGLNDSAMMGLLERRSDPVVVKEVLAGIVGRTGLRSEVEDAGLATWPAVNAGYLYAGWLTDRGTWGRVPVMMERLVSANDPGQAVKVKADDPLFLEAKLWLAGAHRPVARVAGWDFDLKNAAEGVVLEAGMHLAVENPVDVGVDMEMRFTALPGDMEVAGNRSLEGRNLKMNAYGVRRTVMGLDGHLDSLTEGMKAVGLVMRERIGGAEMEMPVVMPVYRAGALAEGQGVKVDGNGEEWTGTTAERALGLMTVGVNYLSRGEMEGGDLRVDSQAATVRWRYDGEFVYLLARCPQGMVSDERNNEWPIERSRWWGTDGLQVQMAALGSQQEKAGKRVVQVAFKPGGVMLTKVGEVIGGKWAWREGQGGAKYGIVVEKSEGRVTGYVVEAAIPRVWFGEKRVRGVPAAWRVNVLRHRAMDLSSSSWSGPVVEDGDVGMMGLLVGE